MRSIIILNNMKKNLLKVILIIFLFLLVLVVLFLLIPNKCENDFKVYPEKGYCEFNLKTCEELFSCKKYNNVQAPCGSVSTLCGEKVLCDCGDLSGNEIVDLGNNLKEINLPDNFKANYISFSNYVSNIFKAEEYPKLESWVENGEIECSETPLESSLPLRTSKKEINGKRYCIASASEGAAGSVYTQFSYTTVIDGSVYSINFIARYNNCSNYPEDEVFKCATERENFNLDVLVDEEIEKLKIKN